MTHYPLPDTFTDVAFWRNHAPYLSIDDTSVFDREIAFESSQLSAVSDVFNRDGYLCLPPQIDEAILAPLRQAMISLREAQIPPVYIYLYDQPWVVFGALKQLISHFLGDDFALLPNFWAWNIPATKGARGWPAHQDCQARTRFPDGVGGDVLLSLSLWVPLSDATLDNGCMAVLPRSNEAAYCQPMDNPDLIKPGDAISLPVKAGSVLGWAQDLYHWSNPVSEDALEPRISLSFEFQSHTFAPLAEPLLDIFKPPPFLDRLHLIASQFDKYSHMETEDLSSVGPVTSVV
jgi:hypothetical protein